MKKEFKKIKLYHDNEKSIIKVGYYVSTLQWVDGAELLKKYPDGCLLEFKHRYPHAQLFLTNAPSCNVILFDEHKYLMSCMPCIKNTDSPFSMLIHEYYALILPLRYFLSSAAYYLFKDADDE